jgi:hypothetical protein
MSPDPTVVLHSREWLWVIYLLGAFCALLFKWCVWVYKGKKVLGKPILLSSREWFSFSLLEEQASWVTTIGVVWFVGAVYIDKVMVLWDWLTILPSDDSFAFLIGSLMEFIAPNITKWAVNKFV